MFGWWFLNGTHCLEVAWMSLETTFPFYIQRFSFSGQFIWGKLKLSIKILFEFRREGKMIAWILTPPLNLQTFKIFQILLSISLESSNPFPKLFKLRDKLDPFKSFNKASFLSYWNIVNFLNHISNILDIREWSNQSL